MDREHKILEEIDDYIIQKNVGIMPLEYFVVKMNPRDAKLSIGIIPI